jgi:uncharacterized protein YbjT (DUF2867 family)
MKHAGHARTALLAGATGLVGRELLAGLLSEPAVTQVHALVRRPLDVQHPKLQVHRVDFAHLPPLPAVHEVYLALGTTIKAAGSRAAFRAVDFDASFAVARAAHAAGAQRLGLVSAMGADNGSPVFYNRVKAELEDALRGLDYKGLVIARPSLLLGDRRALGQPARPIETLMERTGGLLRPLLPRHYRPIAAAEVARALLARVPQARGVAVVLSADMQPRA